MYKRFVFVLVPLNMKMLTCCTASTPSRNLWFCFQRAFVFSNENNPTDSCAIQSWSFPFSKILSCCGQTMLSCGQWFPNHSLKTLTGSSRPEWRLAVKPPSLFQIYFVYYTYFYCLEVIPNSGKWKHHSLRRSAVAGCLRGDEVPGWIGQVCPVSRELDDETTFAKRLKRIATPQILRVWGLSCWHGAFKDLAWHPCKMFQIKKKSGECNWKK